MFMYEKAECCGFIAFDLLTLLSPDTMLDDRRWRRGLGRGREAAHAKHETLNMSTFIFQVKTKIAFKKVNMIKDKLIIIKIK